MPDSPDPLPDGAQKALIEAALRLFGERGYEGTSTRALAAKAGVNVALIAYHFGGKDGLRRACGREVARRMAVAAGRPDPHRAPVDPAGALVRLETTVRALVLFMASPAAEEIVNFLLHELVTGGPVLDEVYDGFVAAKHAELSALWAIVTGQPPDAETVRLSVFALIGQIAYFRIARQLVARRMGWQAIGPDEAARIAETLIQNLRRLTGAKGAP